MDSSQRTGVAIADDRPEAKTLSRGKGSDPEGTWGDRKAATRESRVKEELRVSLRAASLAPLRSAAIKRHLGRQIQSESPSEARASMTTDRGSVAAVPTDHHRLYVKRVTLAYLVATVMAVQMQLSRSRIIASLCLRHERNFGDAQVFGGK